MNDPKKYTVGEIMAAFAIILPSIISFWFINLEPSNKNTNIAAFGCILHCPFSFLLHLHRGLFVRENNLVNHVRTILFKLDVCFIHIHSFLTGYSWNMEIETIETLYHLFCILHILSYRKNISQNGKKYINLGTACGVLLSSKRMYHCSIKKYIVSILSWLVLFKIYDLKLLGYYSSFVMHLMLSIPQFCLLSSIKQGSDT